MMRSFLARMTIIMMIGSVMDVSYAAQTEPPKSQGQSVRGGIEAQAYKILPANAPGVFRAENPAHGMTAVFDVDGFKTTIQKEGGTVGFSLRPAGYGYEGALVSVDRAASLHVNGARIDLVWDNTLTEWHENGPAGLRQNFTLAKRPAGSNGEPLLLTLIPNGDLIIEAMDRGVVLKDASGQRLLSYTDLKVYDATNRTLPATMMVSTKIPDMLTVQVNDTGAEFPVTIDPLLARVESKLTASDGEAFDRFGLGISVSGNTLVVGASNDDDNEFDSGSAYVFECNNNGAWIQTAKLTASDGAVFDNFGYSCSVSGNTVVVGAFFDDDNGNESGSAYVFEKPDTGWTDMTETAKITASDGATDDWFGASVSISANTVVVGAHRNDISGSAYIFEKPDTGWTDMTETAKITATSSTSFGVSVSISGDTVVVGARSDYENGSKSGSACIFEKPDTGWTDMTETAKITASDGATDDYFGSSVSISGDTVVVGARFDDDSGSNSGTAYVFERSNAGWTNMTETAKLTASDCTTDDNFGSSVSISGNTVVVGAKGDDDNGSDSGSAYIFEKPDLGWTNMNETSKITASDGASADLFGISVSVSRKTVAVGAYWDDDNGSSSGSAYVYDKQSFSIPWIPMLLLDE